MGRHVRHHFLFKQTAGRQRGSGSEFPNMKSGIHRIITASTDPAQDFIKSLTHEHTEANTLEHKPFPQRSGRHQNPSTHTHTLFPPHRHTHTHTQTQTHTHTHT